MYKKRNFPFHRTNSDSKPDRSAARISKPSLSRPSVVAKARREQFRNREFKNTRGTSRNPRSSAAAARARKNFLYGAGANSCAPPDRGRIFIVARAIIMRRQQQQQHGPRVSRRCRRGRAITPPAVRAAFPSLRCARGRASLSRLHTLPPETGSNCFISREIFYTNWEVNYGAPPAARCARAPLKIRNWTRGREGGERAALA